MSSNSPKRPGENRFSADFLSGRPSADVPSFSVPVVSESPNTAMREAMKRDKDYRSDAAAAFTDSAEAARQKEREELEKERERLAQQSKAAIENARRRADQDARGAVEGELTDLSKLVDLYESELVKAVSARDRWKDQRGEYNEVLEELTLALSEAQDKAEAVRVGLESQREVSGKRAAIGRASIFVGGGARRQAAGALGPDTTLPTDQWQGGEDEDELLLSKPDDMNGMCGDNFYKVSRFIKIVIRRCIGLFKVFASRFNFFSKDVLKVSARYGGPLVPFFVFAQATVRLGMITLLVYSPLLIYQISNVMNGSWQGLIQCGFLGSQCWLLYGGFDKPLFYLIVSGVNAIGTLIFAVWQWRNFDLVYQHVRLRTELEGRKRFCKVALCAWDFRVTDEALKSHYGERVARNLEALKIEDEQLAAFASLTTLQKRALFARRLIGFVLTLTVIAAGWVAIGVVTIYQYNIENFFANLFGGSSSGSSIAAFIPSLVFKIVNFVSPTALWALSTWEGWPPGVREGQLVWRVFLGSLLNVFLYVGLYYELIAQVSLFGSSSQQIDLDSSYNCKEDQAAISLFILTVSDVVVGNIVQLLYLLVWPSLARFLSRSFKIEISGKLEFTTASYVVSHMVSLSIMWMTLLLSPFAAVWFPLAMSIQYLSYRGALMLSETSASGATEALSVGVLIMRLFCVTAVVYACWSFLVLCVSLPHSGDCGPFTNDSRALDVISPLIFNYFNWLTVAVLAILLLLCLVLVFRNNKVAVFRKGVFDMAERFTKTVGQLQRELKRSNAQNNLFKARLERQRKRASLTQLDKN